MTIQDPPWKKRTRPCPFYSQGRCLFADACNFMHSVTIRQPDGALGSDDSDQPDFRLVVDSPTRPKSLRFASPPRSPRTTSLLLALGDVIQHEEEEEEWDEGESGELESSSGEGSEGRTSEDSAYVEPAAAPRGPSSNEFALPSLHSDAPSDNSVRPSPILGLSDDASRLLHCVPSPSGHPSPHLPEAFITDGSATLVDGISTRSGSPTRDSAGFDEEATVTRLRRSMTAQDPLHSNRQSIRSDFQDSPDGSAIVSDYFPSRRGSEVPDLCAPSRRESEVPVISSPSRRASTIPDPHSPAPSTTSAASVAPESLPLPPSPSRSLSASASELPDIQPPTCSTPSRSRPSPHRIANSHASSISSHDSPSSVLLSPIDLTGARRISDTSIPGSLERGDSFDSGYAEGGGGGPEPQRRSSPGPAPPRTPRRLSTLSILSSPFGSPSARARGAVGVGGLGDDGVPTASALFSPRFGAFPSALARDAQEEARHSRDGSVDSQLFSCEDADAESLDGSQFDDAATDGDGDGDGEVEIQVQRQSMMSELFVDVPAELQDSSLFSAVNASNQEYLGVDEDLLHAGEASFGSHDSMTSLYDQYYTPTVHSSGIVAHLDAEGGQEPSPTMVIGSFPRDISRDLEQESSPVGLPYAQAQEELLLDERGEPEDALAYDLGYLQPEETSPRIVVGPLESSPRTIVASREPLPQVFAAPRGLPLALPDQPLGAEQEQSEMFITSQSQSPEGSVALQEQLLAWNGTGPHPVPSSPVAAYEEPSFVASDFYDEVSYMEPDEPQGDLSFAADDFQHSGRSSTPVRSHSIGSSVSEPARVFSPIQTRPPSSVQVPNFSLPNSARNSVVFAAPSRAASPAVSVPEDNTQESISRPSSSLSQHSAGLRRLSLQSAASVQSSHSSQSSSKKIPFGFRNSVSDRSQLRRSDSFRHRPPPLLSIDKADEDSLSRAATPLSPVEETPLTESPPPSSSNPRRLKPLRLVSHAAVAL
ncbi:hypothetical protein LXA43DRAFT_1010141 [Ganoderma leucocontextum]|nr:hypothetical protein LXA43DRAFT_1010141 [Ganoderma leucocontextum]